MQRICVIDGSKGHQALVRNSLQDCYEVLGVSSIKAANEALARESFDLLLLETNLPDGSGFEFCALVRNKFRVGRIAIIFVTSKSSPLDKVMGFTVGADDYLVKPFHPLELRARVQARLRRNAVVLESSLYVGNLKFDKTKQRLFDVVEGKDRDLNLTPFEFRLLYFLASHPEQFFSRSDLLKNVMDPNVRVGEENIYTHVSSVRKKLGKYSVCLESLPRIGYRFVPLRVEVKHGA